MSSSNSTTATIFSFLFVGALWGCTNPFIKQGSAENVMYVRKNNSAKEIMKQGIDLVKNWRFILPFVINQSGSVAYVSLLGSAEISSAVPICNSLTFVFTAITSRLLGENPKKPFWTYTGMILILLGVAICFHSIYHIYDRKPSKKQPTKCPVGLCPITNRYFSYPYHSSSEILN